MSRQGTIKRYTLIIEKINNNHYPSFKTIQNFLFDFGFELSKRTIERDFEAIRNEFGIEITYNRTHRGYYIDRENSIDIDSFLRFLEIVNTANLLTETLSDSKESLHYISFDKGGGLAGVEILGHLLKATRENRVINFNHFSYQSKETKSYEIHPYLLKEYQNRWYVVGYVNQLKEFRTFGVDRIKDLNVTSKVFKPNKKINLHEKFNDIIGVVYSKAKKERVVLSFTPSQSYYIKSLPLHYSQKIITDNNKAFIIELNVVPNYELTQQILIQNKFIKVVEPKWLANHIKTLLQETLANY